MLVATLVVFVVLAGEHAFAATTNLPVHLHPHLYHHEDHQQALAAPPTAPSATMTLGHSSSAAALGSPSIDSDLEVETADSSKPLVANARQLRDARLAQQHKLEHQHHQKQSSEGSEKRVQRRLEGENTEQGKVTKSDEKGKVGELEQVLTAENDLELVGLKLSRLRAELKSIENGMRSEQAKSSPSHEHWQERWGTTGRSVQCIRHGDGSEACLYEEVCDDGNFLYLKDSYGHLSSTHKPVKEAIDYRFHEPSFQDVRPPSNIGFPFRFESDVKVVSASEWEQIKSVPDTIHVSNAYMSVLETPVSRGGNNLWHFAQSTAMLLDAQLHNETGMYPSMDTVVVRTLGDLSAWTSGLLNVLLPVPTPRLLILKPGDRVCARTAVLLGYRRAIFIGPTDAAMFRERAYSRLGLDIRPLQRETLSYPLRIRFFNRGSSRHVVTPSNQQLTALLMENGGSEKYDLQILDEISSLPFVDQVKLFATADMIVMPHGAGLTNMIFARNHVPVIEIFPRHFVNEIYRNLAFTSGHSYHSIMSERLESSAYQRHPIDEINCEYWHGIDVMIQGECHNQYYKGSSIRLDNRKLLDVVELALESLPMQSFPPTRMYYDPPRPANEPLGTPGQ